jgi:CBS domain-containing protein
LPLLVRGAYYDQFEPRKLPMSCDYEEFVAEVDEWLADTKPVAAEAAIAAVFALLSRHISPGQIVKIQDALPEELCVLWRNSEKTLGHKTLEKKSGSRPSSSAPSIQANGPDQPMQVRDLMTHDVATISPDHTLRKAALLMAKLDVGVLPVGENDRLVGIITDRDMAVRGLAGSKGPNAKVRDVMTPDVKYCFADQVIDEITANMADIQVRRLPVLNRDKRLVGILSLGDIATSDDIDQAAEALSGISRPTAPPAVMNI